MSAWEGRHKQLRCAGQPGRHAASKAGRGGARESIRKGQGFFGGKASVRPLGGWPVRVSPPALGSKPSRAVSTKELLIKDIQARRRDFQPA